jgi:hypothetical protein
VATPGNSKSARPGRLVRGLDGLGSGLDELQHVVGVGDHCHVVGRDLSGGGAHAGGELPLGIGRDGLIAIGNLNQVACDFQTGTPITSSRADQASGCCTA